MTDYVQDCKIPHSSHNMRDYIKDYNFLFAQIVHISLNACKKFTPYEKQNKNNYVPLSIQILTTRIFFHSIS